jgi:hypothetical protein
MDIFFISFREFNCEENWMNLLEFHPNAKRLHGIPGINNVHIACDEFSKTEYFWTVDGDNFLTEELIYKDRIDTDLLMFKAIDPLFESPTLLGGVKIWKKGSIIEKTMSSGDFTLNATKNKKVIEKCFSITKYNDSAFDAWKTAFRHCVKLTSVLFRNRPNAKNIDVYLERWKNSKTSVAKNSQWAYHGYSDALNYTKKYDNNLKELEKINDYDWLKNYFEILYESSKKN